MTLNQTIAKRLNIPLNKVKNTVELLQNDNTVPFIARYRKEVTGNLDEEQIRNIQEELDRLSKLEERRQAILQSVEEQGKMTDELRAAFLAADTLTALEDLYQPYRPKRRTRAMIAREKGLEPLAKMILDQLITSQSMDAIVAPFLSEDVPDLDTALAGAKDIVAEEISENASVRQTTREKAAQFGKVTSLKIPDAVDERGTYESYYQFDAPVKYIKPHQVLAINRGENEKILRVGVQINDDDWWAAIYSAFKFDRRSIFIDSLIEAAEDSAKRLLLPAIERDIRRSLTETAEDHAIQLFANNLRALLTQPPLADQVVLAIDPGFRTGSKFVVIDTTGKVLATGTIYPHPPQNKKAEARAIIENMVAEYSVTLIVIGNGTASRETEQFVAEITKSHQGLNYLITSEAGASVYSASKLARKEFPDLDVSIRGAISIGRRVQDPLAELVKIDPKSIGVGLYQHDVDPSKLSNTLDQVVESVVNAVGVEVNTASPTLLTHVSGIGPSLAEKLVQHREANGAFHTREDIRNVPGMGPKTFEQAAGFLRIRDGENPLDATAIHPESYPVATQVLQKIDLAETANSSERVRAVEAFKKQSKLNKLAEELNAGLLTLEDIFEEIARPGRDPREDLPKPILRKDVLSMDDLAPGMQLKGTIRNVVDFGAFIDIGVKTDGLLHRSRIPNHVQIQLGDIINVTILSIDRERNRIALDMKEA
ncbi:MAG TPA: RNA-binding transcriptional accessory protein [Anaerolineaceae bacterium]|nr:RNA-binding transcriptional accessory protein [Anaerolineaceae bacterium]